MARTKSKKDKNGDNNGPVAKKKKQPRSKKKRNQSKRKARPNKRPKQNGRSNFQLSLPSRSKASVEYNQVPWWSSNGAESNASSLFSSSSISILRHVSNVNLNRLDQELWAFSRYIQLTPQEHQAREQMINHVKDICVNRFANNKTRNRRNEKHGISVQAFGSFATPQVCTFQSDVDVVVWGVVPVGPRKVSARGVAVVDQEDREQTTIAPEQELPAERDASATDGENETVVMQEIPSAGDGLFVIDRVGDAVVEAKVEVTHDDAKMPAMPETATQQEIQVNESTLFRTRAAIDQDLVAAETEAGNEDNRQVNQAIQLPDSGDESVDSNRENVASANHDDDSSVHESEEFSLLPKTARNDYLELPAASVQGKKGAAAGTGTISSFGVPRQANDKVVKALIKLGKALRCSPVTHKLHVRRNARVPIIAMETNLGIELDVRIFGAHSGADTSQYASTQAQRFTSFAPVVLFLKVLLSQQSLDKPFTGGLGSYRLYVLVAHHLEKHLAMGGADRPSEVLVTFLYRFRTCERDTLLETGLSLDTKFECDGGRADLKPVFKLEHCTNLFQLCFSRLLEGLRSTTHLTGSFLASMVHTGPLQRDREDCRARAAQAPSLFLKRRRFNSSIPLALRQRWHGRLRSQANHGQKQENGRSQPQRDPQICGKRKNTNAEIQGQSKKQKRDDDDLKAANDETRSSSGRRALGGQRTKRSTSNRSRRVSRKEQQWYRQLEINAPPSLVDCPPRRSKRLNPSQDS